MAHKYKSLGIVQHEKLCPDIWKDMVLKDDVREKLLYNANDFLDYLKVELSVQDVVIVGSIAGYNWSKYSDIDLHIIIDYNQFGNVDKSLMDDYFSARKTVWNNKFSIKIKGHDVEVYIEDLSSPPKSSGVYSIINNQWIKEPQKYDIENIDYNIVDNKVLTIQNLIDDVIYDVDCDYECAKEIRDKIWKMRQAGLAEGGEWSPENIAFKILKRQKYIEKFLFYLTQLKSADLSLESSYIDPSKRRGPHHLNLSRGLISNPKNFVAKMNQVDPSEPHEIRALKAGNSKSAVISIMKAKHIADKYHLNWDKLENGKALGLSNSGIYIQKGKGMTYLLTKK